MDPPEAEFLAEKEMIKIIPNFSLDKVFLIGVNISVCDCLLVRLSRWVRLMLFVCLHVSARETSARSTPACRWMSLCGSP